MKVLKLIIISIFIFFSTSVYAGKFVLTHMLNKKLSTPAYFYIGEQKVWKLDFRNGEKIEYTIISFQKDNLFCGIKARDNFGDNVKICITNKGSGNAIIEIEYSKGTITYKGYYSE